jgi:hypothetical protein
MTFMIKQLSTIGHLYTEYSMSNSVFNAYLQMQHDRHVFQDTNGPISRGQLATQNSLFTQFNLFYLQLSF